MIFEKICMLVSEQFDVSEDSLELNTSLSEDLGADELDYVELFMAMEEEFEIFDMEEEVLAKARTLGDLVDIIAEVIDDN